MIFREIDVYCVRIEHGMYRVRILFSPGLLIKRRVRTEILKKILISKIMRKVFPLHNAKLLD